MAGQNIDSEQKTGVCAKDAHDRLLNAAEKLFCQQGYDGTSVRDLTAAADCNIAAVNYHFGGKDKLYIAMFQRHMERVFTEQRINIDRVMNSENPTLEKLLEAITQTALQCQSNEDTRIPMMKLIVRETLNPQLRDVVELDLVKDFLQQIAEAFAQLVPGLTRTRAVKCVFAFEGMLMHPMLFYDLYSQLFFEIDVDELIDHLVRFAAAGIRKAAITKQQKESK